MSEFSFGLFCQQVQARAQLLSFLRIPRDKPVTAKCQDSAAALRSGAGFAP
jgi:hypothetical protein